MSLDKEVTARRQKEYFSRKKKIVTAVSAFAFTSVLIISKVIFPPEFFLTLPYFLGLTSATVLISVPSYFKLTNSKRQFFKDHKQNKKRKQMELEKVYVALEKADLERRNLNIQRNQKRDEHIRENNRVSKIRDRINELEEFKALIEQTDATEISVKGKSFALIQGGKKNA